MIDRAIIQFQSGPFMLTGQWDRPLNSTLKSTPGVVFCHGFTGNRIESRRLFVLLSRKLAEHGISTFRFDHRGCGESEGDFLEFTKDGLLEDLRAALNVFLGEAGVSHDRLAVVGYSLGGLSANYLISQYPGFHTAVLWAPVARPDIIRDRLATYEDFKNYQQRGYFDYGGTRVSRGYIDEIGMLNPLEWAKSFSKPVLFIQGDSDVIVKPEQALLYVNARQNAEDRLLLVENGDHAFGSADNVDYVVEQSRKWLCDKLIG